MILLYYFNISFPKMPWQPHKPTHITRFWLAFYNNYISYSKRLSVLSADYIPDNFNVVYQYSAFWSQLFHGVEYKELFTGGN